MLINTKSYCGIPQNNVSGLTKPGEVGNILAQSEIEVALFLFASHSFLAHLAKGNVSFCHHLTSVVVNFSHFNLLL
jgi:hypothetical protein